MDATSLPARFSMNTFFVRHVAKPKRLIHIEGLNRAPICAVNDEGYLLPPLAKSQQKSAFPPNNFNEAVLKSNGQSIDYTRIPRKKEKLLPPMGQFQTYGLIDDTDRWKDELSSLAASVGLLTNADVEKKRKQKEREKYIKSLEQTPVTVKPSSSKPGSSKKPPTSSYSSKTSRLNETLPTGRRTSRGSLASRGLSTAGEKMKYIVDENDRENWMLQVLCQILQTDSLIDVQSWLVSSNPQEKDQVKNLIDQAMKGLEEQGRIENASMSRSGYTSVTKEAEIQASASNLDKIQSMLENMNMKSLNDKHNRSLSSSLSTSAKQSNAQNILKLSDSLDPIPENSPFKIDGHSGAKKGKEDDEKTVINVETPAKDLKIEELKVTMLVKDEKSKTTQEINGNWKPESSIPSEKQNI